MCVSPLCIAFPGTQSKLSGLLLFCFKNSYLFVDLDEGILWRMMSPAPQILRSF